MKCARQAHAIGEILAGGIEGADHEVAGRLVGGQSVGGDQVTYQIVIVAIAHHLVAEPGRQAAAAIDEGRPILDADGGAGQALGHVIAITGICKGAEEPPLQTLRRGEILMTGRFVLADFLNRGDHAGEGERQAADDGQLGSIRRRFQAGLGPGSLEETVDVGDDAGEFRVTNGRGVEMLAAFRHSWREQQPGERRALRRSTPRQKAGCVAT